MGVGRWAQEQPENCLQFTAEDGERACGVRKVASQVRLGQAGPGRPPAGPGFYGSEAHTPLTSWLPAQDLSPSLRWADVSHLGKALRTNFCLPSFIAFRMKRDRPTSMTHAMCTPKATSNTINRQRLPLPPCSGDLQVTTQTDSGKPESVLLLQRGCRGSWPPSKGLVHAGNTSLGLPILTKGGLWGR